MRLKSNSKVHRPLRTAIRPAGESADSRAAKSIELATQINLHNFKMTRPAREFADHLEAALAGGGVPAHCLVVDTASGGKLVVTDQECLPQMLESADRLGFDVECRLIGGRTFSWLRSR